jgi:hypothetical protein
MANSNNFWVIFDTCTRPEYYQDVHNILALPTGSIVRYNYNVKYFDALSLDFAKKDSDFPEDVLLVYGEFENYEKGNDVSAFKKFKLDNSPYYIVPTRICKIKNKQLINEEVYFDLELNNYPYPSNASYTEAILTSLDNSSPFNEISKYVAISGSYESYKFLNSQKNNKDNWAAIVKCLQEKSQFKEDSFWRIEGPFKKNGNLILPIITYNKESQSSYLNHFSINEGTQFYFNLYNYEPIGNVKFETIRKKIEEGKEHDEFLRRVIINDEYSPVISFIKKIDLRQYFISKIKFQRNYNSDLLTKEGACYFNTQGQMDEWPIGANFYLYFQLQKNPITILFAILSILCGVGFAAYSKHLMDLNYKCAIFYAILSVSLFIVSSFLLYRQIKTKI